jgi:hypothetical protein
VISAHAVDPAKELQCRSGEHPSYPVLEGAHVVAGQEVAGADLAALASTGPFAKLGLLGQVAVADGFCEALTTGSGWPIQASRTG